MWEGEQPWKGTSLGRTSWLPFLFCRRDAQMASDKIIPGDYSFNPDDSLELLFLMESGYLDKPELSETKPGVLKLV